MKKLLCLALVLAACSDDPINTPAEGPGLNIGDEVPELGKAVFDPGEATNAKEDSLSSAKGMPTRFDNDSAQVWKVTRDWADTDAAAGMAWPANSNLTWDQKYEAWIESMEKIASSGYGDTFQMTTPYGKTLPAPAIECAETALFLRATFASWYGLPFYVQASDRDGKIFLGHFGFRRANGDRYRTTPAFKSSYSDFSDRADRWERDGWPSDSRLRTRKLGGSQDDFQPFLGDGARAGTYFDELYLNKRVGYFMVYLLSYFGSINLASPSNMYNLKPEAIRAGDVLVKRYRRTGIGHVYVVKHKEAIEDALDVELMSGSMPRRQPKWESAGSSKDALTAQTGGGAEDNGDGVSYAALGGGIKRWRTPVKSGGYWRNVVPAADHDTFVDASDHAAIGARPDRFEQILGQVAPEVKREILLQQIEDARQHLRRYPASCSARTRREDAFSKLYDLEDEHFGTRRAVVDAERRLLEDYALPELVYDESKTCCWNSSNANMFEIIMLKAAADTENHSANECAEPTPFMNKDGGYAVFKSFAESIGRGGEWRAWSEDESCPQRDVVSDTQETHDWTPWCDVTLGGGGDVPPPSGGDDYEPNDDRANAAPVALGSFGAELCGDDPADWFAVQVGEGVFKVDVAFTHAEGDIDIELYAGNTKIGSSTSTGNNESISQRVSAGTYYVKVFQYGQGGACQNYTVALASEAGAPSANNDDFEPNDSANDAAALAFDAHDALLCDGEQDWYALELDRSGQLTVDVGFTHADGDIDIALYDGDERIATSQGTSNSEKISENLQAGTYLLQIKLYGQGNGCQPYSVTARR